MSNGRNQWLGNASATAHIPPVESPKRVAARRVAASYATDAGDLRLLLAVLGLDHIEHSED